MKIFPVIHFLTDEQAMRNAALAAKHGCAGVFLIDMNQLELEALERCAANIAQMYPKLLVGVNRLGMPAHKSVHRGIQKGFPATWTDQCVTHTGNEMGAVEQITLLHGARGDSVDHLCFVGVAFKYQPAEPNPGRAALNAHTMGLIPTTSGSATGKSVEIEKLKAIRKALPEHAPLALASGVSPDNVHELKGLVTHVLVASSITMADGSELIDEEKLVALVERSAEVQGTENV